MFAENKITENLDDILAFLKSEREKVLSEAEWKFRMRGYGYRLSRNEAKEVQVVKLPQNRIIGTFLM